MSEQNWYEVWHGDLYVDTVDYFEMCRLSEANLGYTFKFAAGYGP